MADSYSHELGQLLSELKQRSGRSYDWIGKKVNISKSAVHRLCSGQAVSREFGRVEQIARVCGAGASDIARLFRLWEQANSETGSAPAPDPLGVPVPPSDRPMPPIRRQHRDMFLVAVALGVVVAVLLGTATDAPRPPVRSSDVTAQQVSGPTWMLPPAPVPRGLFGVTINSSTGLMPAFEVGAVRLWDSGTRWADIEPYRGEFDWTVLDRLVSSANNAELPVLFVLGGTPMWANPGAPAAPYPDESRAAPPRDLADWDSYVTALVKRYRGRIEGYELWVLANDRRFFNGSVGTLVEMTRRASRIVRSVDPKAVVVCPGMGNLWTPDGQRVLQEFAEAGGYDYCDVAGIKLYQRSASDPPETMLGLASTIDQLLHASGVQPHLWNTGTTYSITLQPALPQDKARDYAVRFYLVGIYARYLNIERMYFYSWGSSKIPIVLQATGGEPTPAALAVEQLQRWLVHASSVSCGHGAAMRLPDNVWQCEFVIADVGHSHRAIIRWTDSGTAATTAEPTVVAVRRLDGSRTAVSGGDAIPVGEEPVLIEYR